MTKRFRNNALPKKEHEWRSIIPNLRSDDFKDIEKTWKTYLPFNKKDLEEIPKEILEKLKMVPVRTMDEVLRIAVESKGGRS